MAGAGRFCRDDRPHAALVRRPWRFLRLQPSPAAKPGFGMTPGMRPSCFADSSILVVGGAGFVGGTLVRRLLDAAPRRLVIVDNLLSSDIGNVPEHPIVDFVPGSIA